MENQEKTTGSSSSSRALIYLRTAEADEGEITRQEEACLRYLAQRGYACAASCKDNGCSGIGRNARPALDRALAMCESGTIDVLVCTRLDRLSRDWGELLELLARFKAAGVRIEILEEGDVYTQSLRLRLYEQLALESQKAGSQARTSTTYKGLHRYGRRAQKQREIFEREVLAIVGPDLWERAQQTLQGHALFSAVEGSETRPYLLHGLITCGLCGLTYIGTASSGGRAYYACNGKSQL